MLTGCQIVPSGESGWAEKHPNILFAISDDQSYPHASAYGFKAVRTPALDRVAESGVLFSNAFVASPGCSPSRAALLTGRHTWQLEHAGTHASSFPKEYVVYPDLLEKAGYFVGYTGKGWGPGNWEISGRTRNPAGPEYNQHRLESAPSGISDKDYTANFQAFLEARPNDKPFCFWFGGHEPHRRFERGVGLSSDKKLEDVAVPPFLPDTPEIRSDILDYAVEIEWFDRHLGQMLKLLEERGELENTLVVVTSDNGMAFPRAKANLYEYGIHVPLAISWPAKVAGRRVVDDPVSLIDLAPTFLEAAGVEHPGTHPMVGRSLMNILISDKQGIVDPSRQGIFSARERHSSSRYDNLGYPCRVLRTRDYLYIRNFTPERWPAGAPQKYEENGKLGPMHGAYHDIDASPTLSLLLEKSNDPEVTRYFHLAVDKRPDEELYDIRNDPGCLNNLADSAEYAEIKERLRSDFEQYLTQTQDPRMGEQGDIFETYPRYSRIRRFPKPEENHQGN
ncbi:sulfatase [Acidobacteria bacterium AH-259-A15]|nr:sulfatase [Acidobacteria bacterium AH-259-A15]